MKFSLETIRDAVLICIILLSNATFLILLTSCNVSHKQETNNYVLERRENDQDWLKGKKVLCIDSIIEKRNKVEILYIFNYYDCESCVKRGFLTINEIDKRTSFGTVKAIASMYQEVSSTQRDCEYRGYIHKDTNDLLRKELKYIPTPILLIIDDSCKIEYAHIFDTSTPDEDIKELADTYVSLFNSVRKI